MAGLGQNSSVLWILLCPNGLLTSLDWISKESRQQTLRVYCPNIYTVLKFNIAWLAFLVISGLCCIASNSNLIGICLKQREIHMEYLLLLDKYTILQGVLSKYFQYKKSSIKVLKCFLELAIGFFAMQDEYWNEQLKKSWGFNFKET